MDTLTDKRLEREFKVTEEALKESKIIIDKKDKNYKKALKFKDTATRYFKDAKFFKEKGDKASAFGALNYAFGWIDAGRAIGFFEEKFK
jgi:uncharacterized protein